MAYNLQPLITILEQILNPKQTRWILDHNKPHLETLLEKAVSLRQILEKYSLVKIDSLESQIQDAAHKAEDIIESQMVDDLVSTPRGMSFTFFTPDLQQVTQELAYVMKQVEKLIEEKTKTEGTSSSGASFSSSKSVVLGVDEDLLQLKDRLAGMQSKLEITPDLQQVSQELDSVMKQVVKLTSSTGASFSSPKSVVVGVDEGLMQLKDQLTEMQRKLEIDPIVGMGSIDLQEVAKELGSLLEQVVKLKKKTTSSKNVVVGLDNDLSKLRERLTGTQKELQIISIVGMGGLGKTTLAQELYDDGLIVSDFKRGWATISQDYNMRSILLSLLRCIIGKEVDHQHIGKENSELKDVLYQSLFPKRYLIVLDDIWRPEFWDEIRSCFPKNDKRSRILITTRELKVAKHADPQSRPHQMQLLTQSDSWTLLQRIVFGNEVCPDLLREIGEKIASGCGGLPLAISVIGGLLSDGKPEVWKNISNDVTAAIAEKDKQLFYLLSLSYNHLPNHLKPCFLYMGAFREDYEIKAPKLTRLWVAEGFVKGDKSLEGGDEGLVKSNRYKSLEEEAEDYLTALVERNLLLVKEKKYNGKPKRYSMHDLVRDLCIRKAREEKFLYVNYSPELTFSNQRRVSVHVPYGMEDAYEYDSPQLMSLARSFLSTGGGIESSFFSELRLLRVLDVTDRTFRGFPTECLQLVNLRYLAIQSRLPSEISRLWNLQTLIARGDGFVPFEIWELPELRHLKLKGMMRFKRKQLKRIAVLKKLQTTSMITLTPKLIEIGFFESIPEIRKLEIYIPILPSNAIDLSLLDKLEALRCVSGFDGGAVRDSLPMLIFPSSLRKLTLMYFELYPSMLSALCELRNLEMLYLNCCDFEREAEKDEECEATDEEWEVAEGDVFRSLQFLSLASMSLKRWTADGTNFPKLRHLAIRSCHELEEIPCDIGEISTLQLIELEDCKDPLVDSAKQILESDNDIELRISNY